MQKNPSYEPFSFIKEGFSFNTLGQMDISCNCSTDLKGCVQKVIWYKQDPQNLNTVNGNLTDLSQNILNYNTMKTAMLNPDPNKNKYFDYIGNTLKPPPTIQDGIIEDNYTMMINENTLHIVGSITLVSLLVSAIVLAK
jgi:hypothetical protein